MAVASKRDEQQLYPVDASVAAKVVRLAWYTYGLAARRISQVTQEGRVYNVFSCGVAIRPIEKIVLYSLGSGTSVAFLPCGCAYGASSVQNDETPFRNQDRDTCMDVNQLSLGSYDALLG